MGRVERPFFLTNRQDTESAKNRKLGKDYAFDALFEDRDVEVDEESKLIPSHFQVGKNLGSVDGS